jgi:hypothetical protein
LAVASSTNSSVTAQLRAGAAAPAQQAPVEVVLSDAQLAARQAAAEPTLLAAAQQAQAAESSSGDGNAAVSDYHWRYLAAQPPPLRAHVEEVWSAWQPRAYQQQLAALSGDVFGKLPKHYNSEQKNPCWGSGPQLACLPFFNIIGVSKCGTTDLYHRLTLYKQHILAASNKVHASACVPPPRYAMCSRMHACMCARTSVRKHCVRGAGGVCAAPAGPPLLGRVPLPAQA